MVGPLRHGRGDVGDLAGDLAEPPGVHTATTGLRELD